MRILIRLFVFSIVFMLPGCMGWKAPDDQATLLGPPQLEGPAQDVLDSLSFTEGNWPNPQWWEMFGSSELNAIVESALADNPSLSAAKYRVIAAEKESVMARSVLFPLSNLEGDELIKNLSRHGLIKKLNPRIDRFVNWINMTFTFNWELDFWQRYRNKYRASVGRALAQIAESKDVEVVISTSIVEAYYALKTNLYRKQLYEELLQARQNIYDLQWLLFEEALMSDIPPNESAQKVGDAKKFIDEIDAEIAVNIHKVNLLRGQEPAAPFAVDTLSLEPPQTTVIPDTLSLELVSRRPDLMAAVWKTRALAREVDAAIADFYPNFNLKGIVGLDSVDFKDFFKGSSFTEHLWPAFTLPLYTAGAIGANVDAKRAEFNQAVADYNDLLLESAQQVADALAVLRSVYDTYHTQLDIIYHAEVVYDLTHLNYQQGLDNLLQVYSAQVALIERQLQNAQLLYDQYLWITKLIKALGGGYHYAEEPE